LSRRYKSLVAMRLKRQRAIAAPRYSLGGCLTPGRETVEPHTNFSSVEPALIACLRWHGLTREWKCARERAARLDLLRLHRVRASMGSASTTPLAGVQAPRSSSGPASSSTLYSQVEPADASFRPVSPRPLTAFHPPPPPRPAASTKPTAFAPGLHPSINHLPAAPPPAR
jgi:hypothetical protein